MSSILPNHHPCSSNHDPHSPNHHHNTPPPPPGPANLRDRRITLELRLLRSHALRARGAASLSRDPPSNWLPEERRRGASPLLSSPLLSPLSAHTPTPHFWATNARLNQPGLGDFYKQRPKASAQDGLTETPAPLRGGVGGPVPQHPLWGVLGGRSPTPPRALVARAPEAARPWWPPGPW